uniref:Phosphotyrosine protein phosphatase I domain-containing protein n=1 Tax=Aegilops tauschii TaxID=37682 RepID=R7W604_AEGTA
MAVEASTPAPAEASRKPFAVLFVCLAEAVFRNLVSKRGLESKFQIDSAGTIGYHEQQLQQQQQQQQQQSLSVPEKLG